MYAYMAGGKQGFEQNIIFMTYLISPFLKSTVTDSIPSDRDITLAAYKFVADTENPHCGIKPSKLPKSGPNLPLFSIIFFVLLVVFVLNTTFQD